MNPSESRYLCLGCGLSFRVGPVRSGDDTVVCRGWLDSRRRCGRKVWARMVAGELVLGIEQAQAG